MAKKSAIEKNIRRIKIVSLKKTRRENLKSIIRDKSKSIEDRFEASCKLAKEKRDGSLTRVRNRCLLTGRPRGYYRKLKMSRIALRDLASIGQIPGMTKSSW